ncbi:MAG: hypothetical protein LC637_05335 [Xanthomonadaceae bacterium]|nr:hypothetical protein [Xanthomonadaceae bacterium]
MFDIKNMFSNEKMDRVYQQLVNEEDARVCTDISSEACKVVPGNFLAQVATQFMTKLGDAIANPKTVLAWLMTALSVPPAFTSFLVPIRESGSLIPQLIIAAWVRRQSVRKWTFVLGSILQGVAVAAMALVAVTLDGNAAGAALLAALAIFSLSRGLCSALSAPFFILLAHQNTQGALVSLGLFVIADGVAGLVSAPFWGRFADSSSRQVMIIAGAGSAVTGLILVALVATAPALAGKPWLYPIFFFFLSISHAGVRMGRKTYIVDLAGGNKRTDYVAVSNTVIGFVLLAAGAIGALSAFISISGVIVVLAAIGIAGAWMSSHLSEVT